MKPYLAILKGRLLVLFQYRSAALAGLGTQVFWGLVKIMILEAFYASSTIPEPLSLSNAITFIWLGQGLLQLLPWNIDKDVETQVRSGNVAYELLKPLDLYLHWFMRAMAMRVIPTLMRSLPLFLLAALFLRLPGPISTAAGAIFGVSVVFAALLSSAMTALVLISLFWTLSGEGIQRMLPHVTLLLSGLVVPLPLFPEWMQPFLSLQPFRCIVDIPSRLYTGLIPMEKAVYYLALQLVWFGIFVVAGRWLISKAVRQFVIQGG